MTYNTAVAYILVFLLLYALSKTARGYSLIVSGLYLLLALLVLRNYKAFVALLQPIIRNEES